nr:MAG TPA: 40S ribosomal subunit ribosome [Caudoviricetes sp.]
MERLTKTYSDGTHGASDSLPCGENSYDYKNLLIERLGKYEDLEEQGRLIKLPCKIGDIVWINSFRPYAYTITAFSFGYCDGYIDRPVSSKEIIFYISSSNGRLLGKFAESEIGKSVFLSKSEAEAKLKELRGVE